LFEHESRRLTETAPRTFMANKASLSLFLKRCAFYWIQQSRALSFLLRMYVIVQLIPVERDML
jgi:hypothetical protein